MKPSIQSGAGVRRGGSACGSWWRRGRVLRRGLTVGLLLLLTVAGIWAQELRIMSLNAEWYPGRVPEPFPAQRARHIQGLQQLLASENPDLLLLQEIRVVEAITNAIAVLPDYEIFVSSAYRTEPHQFVMAGRVAVRASGAPAWQADDIPPAERPPRGFSYVILDLPDGRVLPVFAVHFKSNYRGGETYDEGRNVAMRAWSARLLVGFAQDLQAQLQAGGHTLAGILIGGDFNATYPVSFIRGETIWSVLDAAGFAHLGGSGVDHFWGRGIDGSRFRKVVPERSISDHAPIALTLSLPGTTRWQRTEPRPLAEVAPLAGNPRTNINTAKAAELHALPGIGPVLAARILRQRPFASIEDLLAVYGIGPATLDGIREWIDVK